MALVRKRSRIYGKCRACSYLHAWDSLLRPSVKWVLALWPLIECKLLVAFLGADVKSSWVNVFAFSVQPTLGPWTLDELESLPTLHLLYLFWWIGNWLIGSLSVENPPVYVVQNSWQLTLREGFSGTDRCHDRCWWWTWESVPCIASILCTCEALSWWQGLEIFHCSRKHQEAKTPHHRSVPASFKYITL